MEKKKLLIKFPSRSRPARFMETFNLYKGLLSGQHDVQFVLSFDADDVSMNNAGMHNWLSRNGDSAKWFYGNSTSKISAINADMDRGWDYDVLLLASDDMIPVKAGYDDIIMRDMAVNFPDFDGVLHYNDGRKGEALNTLSIMGKKYYDRFGYIYHPSYKSVFCDNEFTDVSRILHKVVYIDNVIIKHYWIDIGVDALYQRNEHPAFYHEDGQNYSKRRERNFDIHANSTV
jgi:hypothetical protein